MGTWPPTPPLGDLASDTPGDPLELDRVCPDGESERKSWQPEEPSRPDGVHSDEKRQPEGQDARPCGFPKVVFTRLQMSRANGCITKRYDLVDNALRKTPAPDAIVGRACILEKPLHEIAADVRTHECNVYGVFAGTIGADLPITTRAKARDGELTRTLECFQYRNGPGVLLVENDPHPEAVPPIPALDGDALLDALVQVLPDVADTAYVAMPSSSAGRIRRIDTGEVLRECQGLHLYLAVLDAADIPRFGKVLFARLWLAGFGSIVIARNGALLVRTLIDAAVFSPERIDYVVPAVLGAGLARDRVPPTSFRPGEYLNTRLLPDLSLEEQQRLKALVRAAKARAKPQADVVQAAYLEERTAEMVAAGVAPQVARETAKQTCAPGRNVDLYADFRLTFAQLGTMSVADVLATPDHYDGEALADPIEGPAYGITTAKFYWNDGKPTIHSFAHGGVLYFLHAGPPIGGAPQPNGEPDAGEADGTETPEDPCSQSVRWIEETLRNSFLTAGDILASEFVEAFATVKCHDRAQAARFRSEISHRCLEHRVKMAEFDRIIGDELKRRRMSEHDPQGPVFWELVGTNNPTPSLMQHSRAAATLAQWLGEDRLRYDPNLQTWFEYGNGLWERLSDFDFRCRLTPTCDSGTEAVGGYSRHWLDGVVELVRSHLPAPTWNRDVGLIPFRNGVLRFADQVLTPHSPDHRFDWQMPVNYSPDADCPGIRDWLQQMSTEGATNVVRAFARAILTGKNPTNGLQRYLEIVGPGGSGKSTLMSLLTKLVGPSCYSTSISLLETDKFEAWKVLGHRLLTLPDSSDWRGSLEMTKRLTGGDQLPARKMHSQQVHREPYFEGLLIMTANQPLVSNDQTSGPFRRRITLHFTKVIPNEDQVHQEAMMLSELAGFVNWCLAMPEADADHYLRNTIAASLDLAAAAVQNLLETNAMAAWAHESLVYDPAASTPIGDYRSYRETVTVDAPNVGVEDDGAYRRAKTRSRDVVEGETSELYASYFAWHTRHGHIPRATSLFGSSLVDLLRNQFRFPNVEKTQHPTTRRAQVRGVRLRTQEDAAIPLLADVIIERASGR